MGVAVVVPFYMLFGKGFKASYGFYRKRFGWNALKSFWWSYKNHYRFGQVMIDRFARYAGKTFTLTTENLELYNELEQGDDAFVMLSAHVATTKWAATRWWPSANAYTCWCLPKKRKR